MGNYLVELTNLIEDSLNHKVGLFAEGTEKFTDQAIREGFFEILGADKLTWQGWRNHKNEIFTVMENVLTSNLPLAWEILRFMHSLSKQRMGHWEIRMNSL